MRYLFLLILIASALFLSGASEKNPSGLEPIPKKEKSLSNEQKISADQEQDNTKSDPIPNLDKPGTSINNQKTETNGESAKQSVPSITDWIMVGVTTAYAVFAFLQWRAIRRQAAIAEKSLLVLERAWLKIIFIGGDQPLSEPQDVFYKITNIGRSAAYIKECKLALTASNKPLDYEVDPIPTKQLPTVLTAFPNEEILQLYRVEPTTATIMEQLKSGSKMLTMRGHMFYDDVFGNRHVTRFHLVYQLERLSFIIPRDIKPEYNEAT